MTVTCEMDMIRTLMVQIGGKGFVRIELVGSQLLTEGHDGGLLAEHLGLLVATGFLQGRENAIMGARRIDRIMINGVTTRGRQFIDASRNALAWAKLQHFAERNATTVNAGLLRQIASAVAMRPLAA